MKYLKYYISTLTLITAIHACFLGEYYPTLFFVGFSLFIILGDMILREDSEEQRYAHTFLLDLPMYLNFIILTIIILMSVFVLSSAPAGLFANSIMNYLNIDHMEFSICI